MPNTIVSAPITPKKVQRLYDFLSPIYEHLTRNEKLSKEKGLQVADIKKGFIALEVGFGTGQIVIELAL